MSLQPIYFLLFCVLVVFFAYYNILVSRATSSIYSNKWKDTAYYVVYCMPCFIFYDIAIKVIFLADIMSK